MEQALYLRIAGELREAIVAGVYGTDDTLPSENELALRYATSRVTVRKSLHVLESEGLVRPRQGKGYIVQPPRHTLFTLVFGDSGEQGRYRYQEVTMVTPEREVTEALNMRKGQLAIAARRVLERNGRNVAYDEKFIPYERGVPSIELELHFSEFPDMFTDRFVSMSLRTEMTIDMEPLPTHVARALQAAAAQPLLVVNRLILTADGQPVGYGKQYLTADYGPLRAKSGYYAQL